jgi:hypothetical protein
MMHRKLVTVILLMLLSSVAAFGQSSFLGLTPGRSTKTDVERVLGQPVNKTTETLWEYESRSVPQEFAPGLSKDTGPIFVQWRKGSAVVERIELACGFRCILFYTQSMLAGRKADATEDKNSRKRTYYGAPEFTVVTYAEDKTMKSFAFYSKELYEAVVPKTSAAGITGNSGADAASAFGPMREGYDLNGENYRVLDLAEPRPELCQAECARDAQCKGYTYVKPGTYNYPSPRCWLKSSVGTMFPNAGAVSGIRN